MLQAIALASLAAAGAYAQQAGTNTPEVHPKLTTSHCTASGCTAQTNSITLDSNWRWLHSTSGSTNCYTGNTWDATLCPDPATCASNCALDGADYSGTYGITTTGAELKLDFVTGSNVGSRVYLMNTADSEYAMFNMKNKEFTFDVDLSALPCGLNGALYFSEMTPDGGMSAHPTNKAGAKYGTGYCDSQCPHDIKFIHGAANINNWTASANSANTGTGNLGACCQEMDVWEANSVSAAYTPHPCDTTGPGATTCEGAGCSLCDQAGCDFNSYRMGNDSFYGPGKTVDTKSVFTVVTQFITADGTDTGDLSEIKRFYVQNGKTIPNSASDISGVTGNSITGDFCTAQKKAFGDTDTFSTNGGLKKMGDAFEQGMVLVMSVWDDYAVNMLWLDSDYPTTKAATSPGVARGTCATTSGAPKDVEGASGSASVTFSNIKSGPLGSTFKQ